MTKREKQKQKMKLNTLIDIEETRLRSKLKKDANLALAMLCAFRPKASLRQIKNTLPKEWI